MAVTKVTTYRWYWKKKTGTDDEYTVFWKDPLGELVCSMDVKIIGEEELVSSALSQAANDLKGMYPTVFKIMSDNAEAITVIDVPSPQSTDGDGMDTILEEDVIEFKMGGEEI